MHSNSTSGAFDDLGDIHTAKRDINQHIATALLALQCVGLHPVMVQREAGYKTTTLHSLFYSLAMKYVRNTDAKFLWRHQAKLDGQMHILTNTFRGQYMFTKSFALTYLHSFFSFFPDRLQMIQSCFISFPSSAPPGTPLPPLFCLHPFFPCSMTLQGAVLCRAERLRLKGWVRWLQMLSNHSSPASHTRVYCPILILA